MLATDFNFMFSGSHGIDLGFALIFISFYLLSAFASLMRDESIEIQRQNRTILLDIAKTVHQLDQKLK